MKQDDQYLKALMSQISFDSLLVMDKQDNLRRVFCPFKAKSRVKFPEISKGEIVVVDQLAITTDLRDVYLIGQKPYYSIHFIVLIE